MGDEKVKNGKILIKEIGLLKKQINELKKKELKNAKVFKKLQSLSITDELTGLYNRRGFSILSKQHISLANRTKKKMALFYLDLDNLKGINDTLGHHEGDRALTNTAGIIKKTIRESDIAARIGGDEFAVLAIEADSGSVKIGSRLQKNLNNINVKNKYDFNMSISAGAVYYDPKKPCSIDKLISQADKIMYIQKRSKRR